jgi:hypothetical protein
MSLYGNKDAVSNTSQEWTAGFKRKANTTTRGTFYGNNTVGARAATTMKVGAFAVAQTQIQKQGQTKVLSVAVATGAGANSGANYTNGDVVTLGTGVATTNATFTVTTGAANNSVASLTLTTNGVYTTLPTTPTSNTTKVTSTNPAANGLVVSITVGRIFEGSKVPHAGWNIRKEGTGGRVGRVQYETLVAGGISGASNTNSVTYLG